MPRKITQDVELDVGRSVEDLRAVEDAAQDVDRAVDTVDDREVTVDATAALARLAEIRTQARALADEKVAIRAELDAAGVSADVDKVRRELDAIDTSLDVTLDVDEGGVNTTTSAVNDVFSELGVAGADTAIGISQAFNDAAEQAKTAFGPDSGIARALSGIGVIGTAALGAAVGGILYWWQQIKAAQDEANESAKRYGELLEEANGNVADAAILKVLEEFADPRQLVAIDALGLSYTDLAKIIAGETVPAWEQAQETQEFLLKSGVASEERYVERLRERYRASEEVARQMLAQAGAVRIVDDALADEASELRRGIEAYEAKRAIVDRTIEQVGGYRAAVEAIPEEVLTELEPFLDPALLEQVRAELDRAAAPRNVKITPDLGGIIAPGYAPTIRTVVDVNLNNGIVTDPVGLGREIGRYLEAAGRFGWRAV